MHAHACMLCVHAGGRTFRGGAEQTHGRQPHRATFEELLVAGDRELVLPLLKWAVQQPDLLRKRAFVGHHLTPPDVRETLGHPQADAVHDGCPVPAVLASTFATGVQPMPG